MDTQAKQTKTDEKDSENEFPKKDNCRKSSEFKGDAPQGWKRCAYWCKSSGQMHPRFVPVEFECPNFARYAPGLNAAVHGIPKPRNIGDPYTDPWSYFIPCKGMAD